MRRQDFMVKEGKGAYGMNNYRASRDDLLARLVQKLSNDEQFVAAWLTGSFSRTDADAVSDLDLTLVVSDLHSENLCKRIEQVSPQTTEERLELFSQFGTPAIIHENNFNAPEGGTFTFVLYSKSGVMVDWTLIPQGKAYRPAQAHLLFEKSSIPVKPPPEPVSLDERIKKASEITAFFWMMMAVTSKYIVRQDHVFVTHWLEELNGMLCEIERLIAGRTQEYQRGSLSAFEPTSAGQKQAILRLGERMQNIIPELIKSGGEVLPSPMPEIRALLDLANDE